jgi:hypothetical protein
MMPLSQIDMVVLLDDSKLQVCGGLQREIGNLPGRPAHLYVVVRQGDVIATGNGTSEDDGTDRWVLKIQGGPTTQLRAGPAIACGVAIVEKDPAGLEAFSWAQQVDILAQDPSPGWDPQPIVFRDPQQVFSKQGQLDAAQAIASSLTITPSDAGNYHWAQEVEVRPLAPAIV